MIRFDSLISFGLFFSRNSAMIRKGIKGIMVFLPIRPAEPGGLSLGQ
jgi:hypothetical protein